MESRRVPERVAASVGALGLLAVLPFYVSSGLVAPLWAVVLVPLFWAALAVCAFRWFTRRPWVVLVLPMVAVAIWFLALTLGERLLGWQA